MPNYDTTLGSYYAFHRDSYRLENGWSGDYVECDAREARGSLVPRVHCREYAEGVHITNSPEFHQFAGTFSAAQSDPAPKGDEDAESGICVRTGSAAPYTYTWSDIVTLPALHPPVCNNPSDCTEYVDSTCGSTSATACLCPITRLYPHGKAACNGLATMSTQMRFEHCRAYAYSSINSFGEFVVKTWPSAWTGYTDAHSSTTLALQNTFFPSVINGNPLYSASEIGVCAFVPTSTLETLPISHPWRALGPHFEFTPVSTGGSFDDCDANGDFDCVCGSQRLEAVYMSPPPPSPPPAGTENGMATCTPLEDMALCTRWDCDPTDPNDSAVVYRFSNHDAGVTLGNSYLGYDTLTEPLYVVGQWYSGVDAYHPNGVSSLGNTDPNHVRHERLYNFVSLLFSMSTKTTTGTPGYSSSEPEMVTFDILYDGYTPAQAANPADSDPFTTGTQLPIYLRIRPTRSRNIPTTIRISIDPAVVNTFFTKVCSEWHLEFTVWVNPSPFPYSCALINKHLLRQGPTVPYTTSYLPSSDPGFGVDLCIECDLGDDELHLDRVDASNALFSNPDYRTQWLANNDMVEDFDQVHAGMPRSIPPADDGKLRGMLRHLALWIQYDTGLWTIGDTYNTRVEFTDVYKNENNSGPHTTTMGPPITMGCTATRTRWTMRVRCQTILN